MNVTTMSPEAIVDTFRVLEAGDRIRITFTKRHLNLLKLKIALESVFRSVMWDSPSYAVEQPSSADFAAAAQSAALLADNSYEAVVGQDFVLNESAISVIEARLIASIELL